MHKTTVYIDEKLLEKARKISGIKTKKAVIEKGLKELINKRNISLLREELGSYNIDLDLKKLDKLRKGL